MSDPVGRYVDWLAEKDNATLIVVNILGLAALFVAGISLIVWAFNG